jgi:oligopeptidase B
VLAAGIVCALLAACGAPSPTPPVAEIRDHRLEAHGDVRIDPYYWLRERTNPEVLAYLESENAYTDAVLAEAAGLRRELFDELTQRIAPDDASVPAPYHGHYYLSRYEEGLEYPIYCRRDGSADAPDQVLLDVNQVAAGQDFCSVRSVTVSPDSLLLAWAVDTVGRRKYTIQVTDLSTGDRLPDTVPEITGNLAWANDSRTLFYTKQDPETLRSYQVWRHHLGTASENDELVYQEDDPTFSVWVTKALSEKYLFIVADQTLASEVRAIDADRPGDEPQLVAARERGVEYSVDHVGDRFIIRTNLDAENFRIMEAPVSSPGRSSWRELVPGRDDTLVEDVDVFRDFMVVTERRDGLRHLRVVFWNGTDTEVAFDDPTYVTWVDDNREFATSTLRYGYSSLATPRTIYDLDLDTGERLLMKRDRVLGGFEPEDYTVERLTAPARDGIEVPISLVRPAGSALDGSNPLLLYAYGSYGSSSEPWFRPEVVSLLDRGFIFAIAHVRGGQEMGRWWYEDGKLLNKKNTFTDFIDCGRFLVEAGYTSPDRLFAKGGSAGGLLMGAVANMAPELFAGIIANVPWVDVVTTMLDDSIPLTTAEFDEWGNPAQREYYDYMLSYSPYDNVTAQDYPAMLVTTALQDSQVQYFEPAKWVAKLRATKTDDNPLLFKCEMGAAGHGGVSGRYKRFEDTALEYAFMLEVLAGRL